MPAAPLDDLSAALDRLNTTATVVTSAHEGRQDGCFVSFVTAASLEPPRLLVLTSIGNLTHELVEASGLLALHILGPGHLDWVAHFGHQSGRDVDKLVAVRWHRGESGVPILDDAIAAIEGRVLDSMPCGDHVARLVEPTAASLPDPAAWPLTMFDVLRAGADTPHDPGTFPPAD